MCGVQVRDKWCGAADLFGLSENWTRMEKAMNVKSKCEPHHTAPAAGVMNLLVISALLHFPA